MVEFEFGDLGGIVGFNGFVSEVVSEFVVEKRVVWVEGEVLGVDI